MNNAELTWLNTQIAAAWEKRDTATVDLVQSIVRKLKRLEALNAAATAVLNDANDEAAWTALDEALG